MEPSMQIPAPDGDELRWGDDKPDEMSPQEAAAAFDTALNEIAADPAFRQPDGSAVFMVGELVDRYRFRSRAWFSGRLKEAAAAELVIPPGLVLERTGEVTGQYRVRRLDNVTTLAK